MLVLQRFACCCRAIYITRQRNRVAREECMWLGRMYVFLMSDDNGIARCHAGKVGPQTVVFGDATGIAYQKGPWGKKTAA